MAFSEVGLEVADAKESKSHELGGCSVRLFTGFRRFKEV